MKKVTVKYPIGAKLAIIISILVLVSLGAITFLVSYLVSDDVRVTAENNNLTINSRSATSAENELTTIRSNVFQFLDLINAAGPTTAISRQAESFFFERNINIATVMILSKESVTRTVPTDLRMVNNVFFLSNEIEENVVDVFLSTNSTAIERSCNGEVIVLNAAPQFGLSVLALLYPWQDGGRNQTCLVLFSSETLSETLGTGSVNESFMVNDSGDLLIYSDFELVKSGANYSDMPLVKIMRENNDVSRQVLYKGTDGKQYFGAYQKLSTGDIGVLTIVQEDIVLQAVKRTTRNNIYLTATVLFLAIVFILFYSLSLSRPIRRLTAASEQIEKGDFDVKLKASSKDEIGVLTESFVRMGKGLAERERLKDTFGRFTNKEIAERAMKGELTLGGETKNCTIFFSDIRSFTAISEKLEPFEVVEFLNEYMTKMVSCVNLTKGVVDKFIGDAVMAVWGAPISAGSAKQDALNCVRSALMMRQALREFNVGRGTDKKPIIKIGCGINTGPVIAGQIGSNDRMEYTVIGDAVNFASRTESLNKPFGSDILITENTWSLIKDEVVVEEMPCVTVKGKEGKCRMFAVVNMPRETSIKGCGPDGPKTMAEVRELLGIPTPDFAKVNPDEEEHKYAIQ